MIQPAGMQNLLAQLQAARESMAQGLATPAATGANTAAGVGGVDFGAMLKSTIQSVDASQQQAATLADRFQTGDKNVSLEDTMVALSKAQVSFQELVQVRNRVVQAYKDVMNLQI